jgi:hypothetical protein
VITLSETIFSYFSVERPNSPEEQQCTKEQIEEEWGKQFDRMVGALSIFLF